MSRLKGLTEMEQSGFSFEATESYQHKYHRALFEAKRFVKARSVSALRAQLRGATLGGEACFSASCLGVLFLCTLDDAILVACLELGRVEDALRGWGEALFLAEALSPLLGMCDSVGPPAPDFNPLSMLPWLSAAPILDVRASLSC